MAPYRNKVLAGFESNKITLSTAIEVTYGCYEGLQIALSADEMKQVHDILKETLDQVDRILYKNLH